MPTPSTFVRGLLCALVAIAPAAAFARTLTLSAASVRDAAFAADGLRVALVEQGASATLALNAESLSVPALGFSGVLAWSCQLRIEADVRACDGPLTLDAHSAELAARVDGEQLHLQLRKDETQVSVTLPFGSGAPYSASLRQVPATWLKKPLAQAWRGGELRGGVFDADAALAPDGRIEASFGISDLGLGSNDGTVATQGLAMTGQVHSHGEDDHRRLDLAAELRGGRLQLGTLRLPLPDAPVQLRLDAGLFDDGHWDIANFDWNDAGVLEFAASGRIEPAALAPLHSLDVTLRRAALPQASQRYARGLLDAQGFGALALKGDLAGELVLDRSGVTRIRLDTAALDVDDGAGLVARGIRGGIDWSLAGERPARALGWTSIAIHGVRLPGTNARWQARDGVLHLVGELRAELDGGGDLRLRNTVLHPLAVDGERASTAFALRGFGYDSADGSVAAARLSADGELRLSGPADALRMQADARLLGGEALAGAFYVELPKTPVGAQLDATWDAGTLVLHDMRWSDPGTLVFSARGGIAPADANPVRALQVDLQEARLDAALGRYAQSWLASKGFPQLDVHGSLSGALHFDEDGLQRFAFNARGVDVRDAGGRFAVDGLDGGIAWEYRGATPPTTLGWRSIELFRIPLGAAKARFESKRGAIVLAEPFAMDVFGGQWRFEKLSLLPRSSRGERYSGSFAITGLEMPKISAAFGWPVFPGSLSGGIPEIVMVGSTIELRGGLDLYVFDGHLGMSGLKLERPFGVAPSLAADIHFQNFDLEQFTSAFSLGGMSGRLFGSIEGLRLVDWSPVALDAWLRTKAGGRLSYKAVDDITSIGGGGGLSNNLQTMALKVFDTFGYSRFGLRCRLTGEVCLMGGIDPLPAGEVARDSPADRYTIIEGSGIPRLDIVGHRRRVDWPTLVRRVQESMQGNGPIVE